MYGIPGGRRNMHIDWLSTQFATPNRALSDALNLAILPNLGNLANAFSGDCRLSIVDLAMGTVETAKSICDRQRSTLLYW